MTAHAVLPVLLRGYDDAWERLDRRLAGLGDEEYRWEPVSGAWTARRVGDMWEVDRTRPDPDPAPVTTIAWRTWHLGSDCLAGYLDRSPAGRPVAVAGTQWHGTAEPALRDLGTAVTAFRAAMTDLGEEGMWSLLGPSWGPYAESRWADLFVHALDELVHHAAEIALLRDLYGWRGQTASR
ncbi:DinB family protein [Modestobacter sp. DSM 44400]|uniref:DinB family protein n=1 Tax=Modestobacter sp. DSM 44400 TaxID=1550230 RepID=UPI00158786A0|nr:DinB family protein [Modestobacter sp. DSM 44400]